MVEDMQGYCFKALISAAKYNVSTEGIASLCKDRVDEYAGCTCGDPTDAVSLASTPFLATLIIRIQKILSDNGVYDKFGVTFDGTPSSSCYQGLGSY